MVGVDQNMEIGVLSVPRRQVKEHASGVVSGAKPHDVTPGGPNGEPG